MSPLTRLRRIAPTIGRSASRGAERLGGFELSPIKEVELRASRIPGVVSLAQGIPSFDTPEPIKRFVQERIAEGLCARYSVTPGLPRLREAISESLRRDGMVYDPDREILVTVGSIEAIAATLLATIDPGDEVLVVSPTYASYLPAIRLAGGEPRFVALAEDKNFDLDPDAIADAANRRTRALLLCNPNNPTGTVFSRQQTLRMLEVAEKHDLVVITRRGLQRLRLRRRARLQRRDGTVGAPPRRPRVLLLQGLRHDGMAGRLPARRRRARGRRA